MPTVLAKQLRKPSGFFGNLVTGLMEMRNRGFYRKIIGELSPKSGEKILEIGYGPGMGIHQIAGTYPGCKISGIDYSDLMYRKASRRNKKFIKQGIVRLQYGDFLTLTPDDEKYDKIFCVNVIYFWSDLHLAFAKIFNMLENTGEFFIYMDHRDDIEKAKFLSDFCKYPVEEVEGKLKNAGFANVEYTLDTGYFIRAKKKN